MLNKGLKEWREGMGLSQRQAAQNLGFSLTQYQRLERGARFDTGAPVELDIRTRLACAAIRHGVTPIPA